MLREMHADILFLGVDGCAMVQASRKVVAVCDSSKFSHRSAALIAPPSSINVVITDTRIQDADAETLRAAGMEVILVQL
jgi:DeoR family transcriptional regulator of aga operon